MNLSRPRWMLSVVILCALGCSRPDSVDTEVSSAEAVLAAFERLDPAFDQVVPPTAIIQRLAEDHEWAEGPVWVPQLNALLYSDVPRNAIYSWTEGEGALVWLRPSGYTGTEDRGGELGSNGLALDPQGQLLIAQHGDRRIARLQATWADPTPSFETVADTYRGERFNSPNDLAVRTTGHIYFTDPPYGLELRWDDPSRERDVAGVYGLLGSPEPTLLVDDLTRPNGVAFAPDERLLYVSAVDVVMAFQVELDGRLSRGTRFADVGGDGMAVDQEGRVYLARGRQGVWVFQPDGTHIGSIVPGGRTSNVAFGDDGSTLYITGEALVRVRLLAKGMGF